MMVDSFNSRVNGHDNIAVPFVEAELKKNGLDSIRYGVEIYAKIFQQALYKLGRQNDMALRDRFKPDLYILPVGIIPPLLCEIKSENRGHPNFAIEFDSYCAAKIWDGGSKQVIYTFVDFNNSIQIKLCWLEDVRFIEVRVPNRFDFAKNMLELNKKYPYVQFVEVPHTGGAGTPFFLIPKISIYLKPLDMFIKQNFIQPPIRQLNLL